MAKVERDEDGTIIAYIAKNTTDDTRIPVFSSHIKTVQSIAN